MAKQGKVTIIFNAIKVCLYITCFIVFLFSLLELILAYKEGTTSQSNGVQVFEELLEPAVTICPKEPFKNEILAFESDKELFEETYSKEEIFADAMLEELMDTSKYIYRTVRSQMYGLCHTLQPVSKVSSYKFHRLKLKKNVDLKLYLHELDEEFWLYRAVFPFPMENLDFHVKNTKPKSFVDLTISKTEIHKMNKTGFSCITYPPNDSFSQCAIRKIPNLMKIWKNSSLTCISPFEATLNQDGHFEYCNLNQTDELSSNMSEINLEFIRNLHNYGCPMNCLSTKYNPVVNTFTVGSWMPDDEYWVYLFWTSTSVEMIREYFLYDTMTLFTYLGGNMGLILGYSVLSIGLFLLAALEKLTWKLKI